MHTRHSAFVVFLLASAAGLGSARPADAALAVRLAVERDGKVILRGDIVTVWDGDDDAEAWRKLIGSGLTEVEALTPDEGDPQSATLAGSIRVVLDHPNRKFPVATLDRLRLERGPDPKSRWRIAAEEQGRVLKAAGIEPYAPTPFPRAAIYIGLAGLVVLAAVMWWFIRYRALVRIHRD